MRLRISFLPPARASMQGKIIQVNVSAGGLPKRAIPGGFITPEGLEGDGHNHPKIHGGPEKAILIIAAEVVDELISRGYPLFYGAMGENLTTTGFPIRNLRIGDQIRAGAALLEITRPRGPCSALDVYGDGLREAVYDQKVRAWDPSSPVWGMSGFYARILVPGYVKPEDIISLVATLA